MLAFCTSAMEDDHTKPRISNNATTYSVPINSWHLPPRHHYFVSQHTVDIQFLPDAYSLGNLEMRSCNSPIQSQEETPNTNISNPENHPENAHLTSGLRASVAVLAMTPAHCAYYLDTTCQGHCTTPSSMTFVERVHQKSSDMMDCRHKPH